MGGGGRVGRSLGLPVRGWRVFWRLLMLVIVPWQTQEWHFLSRVASGDGGNTKVGFWMGFGGTVSWEGGSCVPRRAESVAWKGVRSDGASLEFIYIWNSSVGCGIFMVVVLSAWGRPLPCSGI